MDWLEISTQGDTESVEAIAEVFRRYVYGGVSIEQEIVPLAEGEGYVPRADSPVTVKGYVLLDSEAEAKVRHVDEALWHLNLLRAIQPLKTRVVNENEWKDAWKEFYHVHRIGKRIVVKPSWREYDPRPEDLMITIDPGMAFGTGLHPTTQMTLAKMEEFIAPGQVVLDFGTGSGILAIAAARLGARRVLALDNDSVAVDTARANVALNELHAVISVESGTLQTATAILSNFLADYGGDAQRSFDVVVANIIAKVIVEESRSLAALIGERGIVIASGIIDERRARVVDSLAAAGLEVTSQMQCGDWVALVAQKATE